MFNEKLYMHNYYLIHKKELLEKQKIYQQIHKKAIKIQRKKYRKTHREQRKEWILQHYNQITNQHKQYMKNRLKIDIQFKIIHNLRCRINIAIKKNYQHGSTINLLDCSIKFLKQYLEKQFIKGMSWSNYGKWHIDHIKPCARLDLRKKSEQKKCFHYTNLQPLWAKENILKRDKT